MAGSRWQRYQEEAADFFRALGLEAEINEKVEGVRGLHAVDVTVRSKAVGLRQLWIVECKRWKRKVNKEHVLALQTIVQDVGADRGLLLSEKGFQSGAIRAARMSNVTLTNLADLRTNSEDELIELGLGDCRRELFELQEQVLSVGNHTHVSANSWRTTYPAGFDPIKFHAVTAMMELGLRQWMFGRWPCPYGVDWTTDKPKLASTPADLLAGMRSSLTYLRGALPQ